VTVLTAGVSDVIDRKTFNHVGGHGGTFSKASSSSLADENLTELITIDSLGLTGDIIIKADVEGFEKKLIDGAATTIQNSKPQLLISAYHNCDDLIVLTKKVLELNPDYRVALRHHTHLRWDTCLYFF
jgi:hypothetical protein